MMPSLLPPSKLEKDGKGMRSHSSAHLRSDFHRVSHRMTPVWSGHLSPETLLQFVPLHSWGSDTAPRTNNCYLLMRHTVAICSAWNLSSHLVAWRFMMWIIMNRRYCHLSQPRSTLFESRFAVLRSVFREATTDILNKQNARVCSIVHIIIVKYMHIIILIY